MTVTGEPRGQRSTADVVAAVLLLLAAVSAALAAVPFGALLVMGGDGCGISGPCSTLGLTAGVGVAVLAPSAGVLGFGTWAVVRLVRARRAWWVALAALLSAPALWLLGAFVVWASVGGLSS